MGNLTNVPSARCADALEVSLQFELTGSPQQCEASVDLEDVGGNTLQVTSGRDLVVPLDGVGTINVLFDGASICASRVDGPYMATNTLITCDGGVHSVFDDSVTMTEAYFSSEFCTYCNPHVPQFPSDSTAVISLLSGNGLDCK